MSEMMSVQMVIFGANCMVCLVIDKRLQLSGSKRSYLRVAESMFLLSTGMVSQPYQSAMVLRSSIYLG